LGICYTYNMKNCLLKFKICKSGFTLAEVLITLVIIGVIAALTIPTAINKSKEEELKSQFKKAYSTISQALYKTEMNDFYGYVQCYYDQDNGGALVQGQCGSFFNTLAKNLSLQKVCKGNAKADGCVPAYKNYNTIAGCARFDEDSINNSDYSYVLSNGQIIITFGAVGSCPVFLYDINGHKGPNAYGKDLFAFRIERNSNSGIFTNQGSCEFPTAGCKTTREMIKYAFAVKM